MVIGKDGTVPKAVEVPVVEGPMVYDMALASTYAVLLDLPVTFDLERAMAGSSFPYKWNPDQPARVSLLPRDGGASQIAWCEMESCYVFHVLNAYDDAGTIVCDVVGQSSPFRKSRRISLRRSKNRPIFNVGSILRCATSSDHQ